MLSFCSSHLSVLTNLVWPLSFTPLSSFADTFGIFTGQTELPERLFAGVFFDFCLGFSLEGWGWNLLKVQNKQLCHSVLLDDIREGKILSHMLKKESKCSRCELYSLTVDSTPPTLFVNLAWLRQIGYTDSSILAIFYDTKIKQAWQQVTRTQQFSFLSKKPRTLISQRKFLSTTVCQNNFP